MRNISDKHITILGAVRSGIAAAKLAKKMGAVPFVSDYSNELSSVEELDELGIAYELGGHTDSIGSDENNLKLSQDRVNSVKSYLQNKGISDLRINVPF